MSREPTRVGKDSTEPVDPVSGLTPTETVWLVQAVKHVRELNKLLWERGSVLTYSIERER